MLHDLVLFQSSMVMTDVVSCQSVRSENIMLVIQVSNAMNETTMCTHITTIGTHIVFQNVFLSQLSMEFVTEENEVSVLFRSPRLLPIEHSQSAVQPTMLLNASKAQHHSMIAVKNMPSLPRS